MAPSEPAQPSTTPVLTRSTSHKKTRSAAVPASGAWSRARQWFGRLLGRPVAAQTPRMGGRKSTLDKAELQKVRQHLSEVLDQHPQAREVMKYVRALERGLHKKGRFALDDLPVDVIRRALEQLDTLVTDWSLEGLATLRSKAAVAIAGRELVEAERAERRVSNESDDVEVEEASVTTFMQASEEWERSLTNTGAVPLDSTTEPAKPRG
jgi:hypothetical protein